MWVYGDRERTETTRSSLQELVALGEEIAAAPPGLHRHSLAVDALIRAGSLAQALADVDLAAAGEDCETVVQALAMSAAQRCAEAVVASWRSGFAAVVDAPTEVLRRLGALALPDTLRIKEPEGYAFYAVYPESYVEAVERAKADADTVVIGIRSIGTSLAAAVAASAGARRPITVRPVGHPFQRRVQLAAAMSGRLTRKGGRLAVVDEGPGLSGSSFGAVVDRLESQGIARERIILLPSHDGAPGPQSSPGACARWQALCRFPADFERSIAPKLAGWARELAGPTLAPLDEISGGRWRTCTAVPDAPVWAMHERRKYLMRTATGVWLLKFAGIGRIGEEKLRLARSLYARGFTAEPLGLAHGFLIERWIEHARPASVLPREHVVRRLGDYLAARSRLPAGREDGADLSMLQEMTRTNLAKAGLEAGAAVTGWSALAGVFRRVRTDGRLHPWEWLVSIDGQLLKADALDHCCAHDLVGAQDLTWDIAGAEAEFELSGSEAMALRTRVERISGRAIDEDLLRAMRIAYAAFQLGWWRMAAESAAGEDRARAARQAERYLGWARKNLPSTIDVR